VLRTTWLVVRVPQIRSAVIDRLRVPRLVEPGLGVIGRDRHGPSAAVVVVGGRCGHLLGARSPVGRRRRRREQETDGGRRGGGAATRHRLERDAVTQRRVTDAPAQVAVVPRLIATSDVRVLERRNVGETVRAAAVDRCRTNFIHP